jgi:hypothetical protein
LNGFALLVGAVKSRCVIETFVATLAILAIVLLMNKPFDAHDDQERSEIFEILKELPEDHRAWIAHREGADANALTHLVDKRQDLIERLTNAWLADTGGCCAGPAASALSILLAKNELLDYPPFHRAHACVLEALPEV